MKWLVLGSLVALWARPGAAPARRVSSGQLRGLVAPAGRYVAYLGVPYARTDAEHRFQAPLPAAKWDGVFDAVNEHVRCKQRFSKHMSYVTGQEDCLTLNIYAPSDTEDELLPVMFFIHGGAFFEGSGAPSTYGPDYIVRHRVVLVTINYRLNIQGFLCLGIKEAPGNAGMKDQVAALRWVRDNIRSFGGNPDDVTIFGESAGAASVSYHLLSPMSKGLFHKAILQSGSSLSSWALQYNPVYMASLLAKTMGYNATDPHELYNIFMNKTDDELILTRVPRKKGDVIISELLYCPCVEKEIAGVEAFLTENPYDTLSKGEFNKVPVMIGYNNEEGMFFSALENDTTWAMMSFENSLPRNLAIPTENERVKIAAEIKKIYLGNEEISKEKLYEVSKMHGEPFIMHPALTETELLLKANNLVYNYMFAYSGYLNMAKIFTGLIRYPGATHADELFYLFKPSIILTPQRFLETNMIERMTTIWTNFAKYGNPAPEETELLPLRWQPTSLETLQAYVIDDHLTTETMGTSESMRFWSRLYAKYRRKPVTWG